MPAHKLSKVELSDDGKTWGQPVAKGAGTHPVTEILFAPAGPDSSGLPKPVPPMAFTGPFMNWRFMHRGWSAKLPNRQNLNLPSLNELSK
jgi:hypothetical protein